MTYLVRSLRMESFFLPHSVTTVCCCSADKHATCPVIWTSLSGHRFLVLSWHFDPDVPIVQEYLPKWVGLNLECVLTEIYSRSTLFFCRVWPGVSSGSSVRTALCGCGQKPAAGAGRVQKWGAPITGEPSCPNGPNIKTSLFAIDGWI